MLFYKDIFSKDELLSDSYNMELVDGVVWEADCAMIQIYNQLADTDANPYTEDDAENVEEMAETVNKIVHSFRLQLTSFDKASFMLHIRGYKKKVKAHLSKNDPDQVEAFEKGARTYVKKVISSFDDWEFYTGESMEPDAMVVMLSYREDGTTPFVAVWKHGWEEIEA